MLKLRVKELLEERGWSQEHLADISGLAQPPISRLATGTRQWRSVHLENLSRAFGVRPAALLDDQQDSLEDELLASFRSLGRRAQEDTLQFVQWLEQRAHADNERLSPSIDD